MKKLKHLLVAAVAAFAFNAAFAAEASKNTALLTSPRYLEEHPELLRGRTFGGESKIASQVNLAGNIALANSPRFREAHPELRWAASSVPQSGTPSISESERWARLTANKALAASPRFREAHPEVSREQPAFQVAPLK
jgi:hypothetical protein